MEQRRVLCLGGVVRIVVPNFERSVRNYLDHLALCEQDTNMIDDHDDYIAALLEQSVQREAFGSSRQKPIRRLLENMLLGDARKRGQTHQWMYDRFNLKHLLESAGFSRVTLQTYNKSMIPNWELYGLDFDDSGMEYKPGSLYIEAVNL